MEGKKGGSRSNYSVWESTLKHLRSYHNEPFLSIESVTPEFLEGFKHYLKTQPLTKSKTLLTSNTAYTYFNKVKTALNQAYKDKLIKENPAEAVEGIKPQQNKREYLTLEELREMAKAECKFEVLKRAFLFSCLTGLRWSDIQKLSWSEIQSFGEGKRIVFSQKKTGKLQYLDISDQAYDLMGEPKEGDQKVFVGLRNSAWHNMALLR